MGIKRDFDSCCLSETEISEDEAALYDRQIRLWGIESQKRLREAKILLIGLGGLGAEIAKNIVLAGVKSITLMDNKTVQANDHSVQFLLTGSENGENRAVASQPGIHQLNTNVEVLSDGEDVNGKPDSYFTQFNVICATDCQLNVLLRLNKISREHSIKFFCGDTWGFYGYCFVDLCKHSYSKEKSMFVQGSDKTSKDVKKFVQETLEYCSLEKAMSLKSGKSGTGLEKRMSKIFFLVHILNKFQETHKRLPAPEFRDSDTAELKAIKETVMNNLGFDADKISDSILSNLFGELSPVCAIVGGVLSQEIIKGVSAREEPIQNFFLFDGNESLGVVENIGSGLS